MRLIVILRTMGWGGACLITILMLVPGSDRPHVLSSGLMEHILAYGLTSLALTCGYWHLRYPCVIAIGMTTYAGLLEALQLGVPGRSAKLIDFLMSAAGVWFAFVAFLVIMPLLRRLLSPQKAKERL